ARASALNIDLVLRELDEADRSRVERIGVPATHADAPGFRLDHVSFAHDRESPPLLHRVSSTFPHPSWTASTGASGAGKSALLELLGGIHLPDDGAVIHAWPKRGEHDAPRIAYVPPHVALLD